MSFSKSSFESKQSTRLTPTSEIISAQNVLQLQILSPRAVKAQGKCIEVRSEESFDLTQISPFSKEAHNLQTRKVPRT